MYAIYGNMDPINIPPMLAYIAYMDPMGIYVSLYTRIFFGVSVHQDPKLAFLIISYHVHQPHCLHYHNIIYQRVNLHYL